MIFLGFALHHLQTPEKQLFLNYCKSILRANGLVVVIDIFRQGNETREAFVKRYADNMHQHFHTLTSAEIAASANHMLECDFPESLQSFKELITRAGLPNIIKVAEYNYYGFICFSS